MESNTEVLFREKMKTKLHCLIPKWDFLTSIKLYRQNLFYKSKLPFKCNFAYVYLTIYL